jgi:hypothetical protein
MCTVTFIARPDSYALGMNRDEKLSRPTALPIAAHRLESGRRALFPSEPNGGTWIGVNDAGVSFALVNWYTINARVEGRATSRGEVVETALSLSSPWDLKETPSGLDLHRVNPFRLIGVFLDERVVFEWRWDLRSFERFEHQWLTSGWFSSGFDEPGAQRTRGEAFSAARQNSSAGCLDWLRSLHASHLPERGAYSICMHRSDAATVSYSEIVVSREAAHMCYVAGAPCCHAVSLASQLSLRA